MTVGCQSCNPADLKEEIMLVAYKVAIAPPGSTHFIWADDKVFGDFWAALQWELAWQDANPGCDVRLCGF